MDSFLALRSNQDPMDPAAAAAAEADAAAEDLLPPPPPTAADRLEKVLDF